MDAVTTVSFNIEPPQLASASPQASGQASVFDVGQFDQAMQQASDVNTETNSVKGSQQTEGFRHAVELLDSLNGGMKSIGTEATAMAAQNAELTPSQMLQVTVRAHQFLFQSELTANVANKTSEGIQQLFRQQS